MTIVETLMMTDRELDKAVKIQGTEYDRKRKISDETIKKMKSLLKNNSVSEVAKKLGVSSRDVKYHTDPEFRKSLLQSQSKRHTGKNRYSIENRVAYKRSLVAQGLLHV